MVWKVSAAFCMWNVWLNCSRRLTPSPSLSSSQGKRLQPKTQECKWYFWITVGSFVCVLNVCLDGNCYYGAVFVFVLWLSLSSLSALLCEVIIALYFLSSVVFSNKSFNFIYSSCLPSKFYILAPHTQLIVCPSLSSSCRTNHTHVQWLPGRKPVHQTQASILLHCLFSRCHFKVSACLMPSYLINNNTFTNVKLEI